jgi:hypothetical protein
MAQLSYYTPLLYTITCHIHTIAMYRSSCRWNYSYTGGITRPLRNQICLKLQLDGCPHLPTHRLPNFPPYRVFQLLQISATPAPLLRRVRRFYRTFPTCTCGMHPGRACQRRHCHCARLSKSRRIRDCGVQLALVDLERRLHLSYQPSGT